MAARGSTTGATGKTIPIRRARMEQTASQDDRATDDAIAEQAQARLLQLRSQLRQKTSAIEPPPTFSASLGISTEVPRESCIGHHTPLRGGRKNEWGECDDAVVNFLRSPPAYSEAVHRSGGLP